MTTQILNDSRSPCWSPCTRKTFGTWNAWVGESGVLGLSKSDGGPYGLADTALARVVSVRLDYGNYSGLATNGIVFDICYGRLGSR